MLFDELGSAACDRLKEILDRREPKILGLIRAGSSLTPAERERIDDAIVAESISLMATGWRRTVESEALRPLIQATRALVPLRTTELPGWGKYDKTQRPTGDPYQDGAAADGYGPHPGTSGAIPPAQMPELHLLPDDYDIPDDPAASILGPAS